MSTYESPANDVDHPVKRRIQRRHGACEPCRSSKTKCDGRTPCGACRSERRRQCPCVYSEKAMKLQLVTAEIRRRTESERQHGDDSLKQLSEDETRRHLIEDYREHMSRTWADEVAEVPTTQPGHDHMASNLEIERASMPHPVSICAVVEEFKRLKPARGYSAQVVSRCNGFEVSMHSGKKQYQADSAVPQSTISTTHDPALKGFTRMQSLDTRLGAVDTLIREGHLDRAWADLASIIRDGQITQDQCDEQSSVTSTSWKPLWHKILDLESQVGLTIGRPTGLILPKRLRSRAKNDTLSLEDSLEETRLDLYQHIQGMLALDVNNDRAIRDFLENAHDILHHEPFNQIGLCTTKGHSAAVRELHLNTHLLFMVTFCRVATLCDVFSRDLTNASWSDTPAAEIIRTMNLDQPRQKLAYCRRMFRSANFILDSFVSLHQNDAEQTGIHWLRCHGAYIAALILGIAKLRHEVEWHATTDKLKKLEHIFSRLSKNSYCHLFSAAVTRLRDLNSVKEPASEATRNKHSGIKNRNKRSVTSSALASPKIPRQNDLSSGSSSSASPIATMKRTIDMVDDPIAENTSFRERFDREDNNYQPNEAESSFEDLNFDPLSFFQDNSATYSHSSSSFTTNSTSSSATSFSDSDLPLHGIDETGLNHPGPPFAYPFPYGAFHPPMSWNNPPYVMPTQNGGPLSIHIPLEPQYGPGSSSLATEAGSQYVLHSSSTAQPSAVSSHHSSPLQPSSDVTVTSMRLSPTVQSDSSFKNIAVTSQGVINHSTGGQIFSQQVKTPVLGHGCSNSSGRTCLDRRNSTDATHPSPLSGQENTEISSANWRPTSAVALPHEIEPQLASTVENARETGRRASSGDIRNHPVPPHHHKQTPCYPHHGTQHPPSQQILTPQFLTPEQIAYMNSTGSIFGANQYPGQYQNNDHIPPFANPYVMPTVSVPEQWRRMSVGAVGDSGAPY